MGQDFLDIQYVPETLYLVAGRRVGGSGLTSHGSSSLDKEKNKSNFLIYKLYKIKH